MLLTCGVIIIVIFALAILFAVWHRKMGSTLVLAVGMMGIAIGIVVTNLPNIAGLVFQWGEKQVYGFQWQRAAEQVNTKAEEVRADAAEVRKMREEIQALAQRVKLSEKNVTDMRNNLRILFSKD